MSVWETNTMPPISIKAVLISNAVQFGMTVAIFFIAALVTLGVAWGIAGFPADIDPITDEFRASSLLVSSIFSISVVSSSLAAGYVAGRVAGHRPVLHGALSSCAWFVILISIGLGVRSSGEPPHGGPDGGPLMPALLGATLFFGTPLFGALGGYIARQMGRGRNQPAIEPSQYSKWWWLGYFGVQYWTVEERRARIAMGMTLLVSFGVAMAVVSKIFDWVGIEPHRGAFISAVLSVIFGLFVARPIAAELYRDLLRRADENARKRLSRTSGEVR
jgi:hypothetical protein